MLIAIKASMSDMMSFAGGATLKCERDEESRHARRVLRRPERNKLRISSSRLRPITLQENMLLKFILYDWRWSAQILPRSDAAASLMRAMVMKYQNKFIIAIT